jgi:putative nucleotidyltransferase with HDIG domain
MTASEIVAKIQHLAPASRTAIKLIGLLSQPGNNNEAIVDVLRFDNVLTAKLLRACNSPFYGLPEPVTNVEQAVLIIGYEEILRLVMAFSFNSTMSRPLPGYAAEAGELWHHSLITAFICEALAREDLPVEFDPPVAFTAGLLHDIGKLALSEAVAKNQQNTIRLLIKTEGLIATKAEQQVLETNHAEVGAFLLETWNVPELIVEAVANHNSPHCQPQPKLSALVHAADCLAHLMGATFTWDDFVAGVGGGVVDSLKLTPEKLEKFMVKAQASMSQAEQFGKMA